MGKVWYWGITKRSTKTPYIRIPSSVMAEITAEGGGHYYVVLLEEKSDLKKVLSCLGEG